MAKIEERVATLEDRVLITHQQRLKEIEKDLRAISNKLWLLILLVLGQIGLENKEQVSKFGLDIAQKVALDLHQALAWADDF